MAKRVRAERGARPLVYMVVDEMSGLWDYRERFFMGINTPSRSLTLLEYAAECEAYWAWRRSVGHRD